VRSLEVIGEAASNLPAQFRRTNKQVAWPRIIALRNRLIHGYMGINYNIVVNVLQNEVPVLKRQIVPLMEPSDDTDSGDS
jgi:uncharacterized protein with HEPN domain